MSGIFPGGGGYDQRMAPGIQRIVAQHTVEIYHCPLGGEVGIVPRRTLKEFPAGQVVEPSAQAAHFGFEHGLIEKEEIRPLRAHIKKLREPLNGPLHRLRQRLCRLMGEAGMCIDRWQILHL